MRGTRGGRVSTSGTLIVDKNHPIWKGTNGNGTFKVNTGSGVYLIDSTYTTSGTTLQITPTIFSGTNLRYQFYVDNDLEETNPTVIYDDNVVNLTYTTKWGTGSYDYTLANNTTTLIKGVNSAQVNIVAGSYSTGEIGVVINSEDWSAVEFICAYWYGQNTGHNMILMCRHDGGGYAYWTVTDNFTGWKRFVLPKANITGSLTPNWSHVDSIGWQVSLTNFSDHTPLIFDRIVRDTGQWVKIETGVPDSLQTQNNPGQPNDGKYAIRLFSLYSGVYNEFTMGDTPIGGNDDGYFIRCVSCYLSNQQTFKTIYGQPNDYSTVGQMFARAQPGLSAGRETTYTNNEPTGYPTTITYTSGNGCKNNIGFSLKMPPNDLRTGTSGSISQINLQMDIYGNTTAVKTTMV